MSLFQDCTCEMRDANRFSHTFGLKSKQKFSTKKEIIFVMKKKMSTMKVVL